MFALDHRVKMSDSGVVFDIWVGNTGFAIPTFRFTTL